MSGKASSGAPGGSGAAPSAPSGGEDQSKEEFIRAEIRSLLQDPAKGPAVRQAVQNRLFADGNKEVGDLKNAAVLFFRLVLRDVSRCTCG